ncbi:MAG: hypothetical protein HY564_01175, partial [Candidatus Jacksonbacteria bacterium]|nr:hypothetical protein [Candidatus Jacksonbacteria bacterium]
MKMPQNKDAKNKNVQLEIACLFGFLAIFFVSALIGAASGIGVTRVIKSFAFTDQIKTETIGQASSGSVLGEKEFQIAQTASFDCASPVYSGSPACKGEHPRMYLTKSNINGIRNKIQTVYRTEFQQFVTEADQKYTTTLDYAGIQNFAFLYQMGDVFLDQFTHQHTAVEYGEKARVDLVATVNAILASGSIPWLTPDVPHPFSLGASVGYDWLFDLLSPDEKSTIASAFSLTIKSLDNGGFIPLDHGTGIGRQPMFLCALAFYGDGYNDALAQQTLDKFYGRMLGGGTLTLKDIAASDDGGTNSGHGYPLYFFKTLGLVAGAWGTATGENIFATSSYFRYWPYFLAHSYLPFAKVFFHDHHQFAGQPYWSQSFNLRVGQSFYRTFDPARAGLAQWLIQNKNPLNFSWTDGIFSHFIFGDDSATPQSPVQLNLPLTKHFKGMGLVIMRSGFDDPEDMMITFKSAPWAYVGGYWSSLDQGTFTINKYGGTLALNAGDGAHHWYENVTLSRNVLIFNDPVTLGGWPQRYPFSSVGSGLPDASELTTGSVWDISGIKRFETEAHYDYVYADLTRAYNSDQITDGYGPAIISRYTRQLVYLKPSVKSDADYVVIIDRANTLNPAYEKRWLLHMPYEPQINGQGTLVRDGLTEYQNADTVTITNTYGT